MFDTLAVLEALKTEYDKMNEANIQHATAYGAMLDLLISKGVFTEEEYQRTRNLALHVIEQEFAKKRDEAGPVPLKDWRVWRPEDDTTPKEE